MPQRVLPARAWIVVAAFVARSGARRPSNPDISIRPGAYVAIFSSAPPLPPDVPRTPGMTQTETQLAVARHSAGGMPGLSHILR